MRSNFETVMGWVGLSEGGYVNHPRDPGGATDRGITQATYDGWNRSKGNALKPVRGIAKREAERILKAQYFNPVWFDKLPSGLDYAVSDYAINSGPSRAVKELQRIVGVTMDGVMGSQTLSAVLERDADELVVELCERRLAFMKRLDHWETFKGGWTTRVMGNVDGVQTDDIGVIDRGVRLANENPVTSIPAPTGPAIGRAPEPEREDSIVPEGWTITGVGALAATTINSVGDLHPVAQSVLGAGLVALVAGGVFWFMRRRKQSVIL